MATDGLTTQERIDKEYEELDGIVPEWTEEAPNGEPEPKQDEPEPEPEPPKEDPAIAAIKEEARKAEARYQSLQGMFNKQNEELQALKSRAVEPEKQVINSDYKKPNSDDELKTALTELVEGDLDTATEKLRKIMATSRNPELETIREELNQTRAQTAVITQDRFYSELTKVVPDWAEINANAGDFYGQVEPFTGHTYDTLIKHYSAQGDLGRVAGILDLAKSVIQRQVAPVAKAKNQLERLLEPERTGKGSSPPTTNTKRTYTKAEHDAFDRDYRNYQAGRLKADPAKIEAKWEEMFNAVAEGRVIGL